MTNTTNEHKPLTVPETAQQDGDKHVQWTWAERSVWTDRMLTALEQGVKGGLWFRLIDKVFSERNLQAAATKVIANGGVAGVDHIGVKQFEHDLAANVARLSIDLRAEKYRPQAVRRVHIPKPGSHEKRPLGIPTVQDRVVQGAVRHVIEPIFEREFAEQSYGFRPKRGCKDALRRVDELLKRGYMFVVDADLKSYFDTIPHGPLMERLRERIADGRVLRLIESFLKAGVMDGLREWTPEAGAPQGAVLSPLLSNIYLNALDHIMVQAGIEMVRYADDFVIMCRTAEAAQQALELVKSWTASAGLTLHPTKTRIVDVKKEGFDFLGYHFETVRDGTIRRWPRKKSIQKFRDTIRAKTRRTNGHSLTSIIADLNCTLVGWFGYFRHSHYTTFSRLDGWIRMRLRSILRKRSARAGRGRGMDHHRWPNTYFAKHGLFNLTTAHALVRQSCSR